MRRGKINFNSMRRGKINFKSKSQDIIIFNNKHKVRINRYSMHQDNKANSINSSSIKCNLKVISTNGNPLIIINHCNNSSSTFNSK